MTKFWVRAAARFPVARLVYALGLFYGASKIAEHYCRKEFMRRVRARNELIRLDTGTIKELVEFDLLSGDDKKIAFSDFDSEYLCIFFGRFKTFLRIKHALQNTPYESEMAYLYVTDQDRLKKLEKDTARVPVPNT